MSPNPSLGATSIEFDVPDHTGPVSLVVYNARGQVVKRIVEGPVGSGRRSASWDGTSDEGAPVAGGVYFVRLAVDGAFCSEKLVLFR